MTAEMWKELEDNRIMLLKRNLRNKKLSQVIKLANLLESLRNLSEKILNLGKISMVKNRT